MGESRRLSKRTTSQFYLDHHFPKISRKEIYTWQL